MITQQLHPSDEEHLLSKITYGSKPLSGEFTSYQGLKRKKQ